MPKDDKRTFEDRLRAVEDRLEILNLIASHPPSADTGADHYVRTIYLDDGVIDLGGGKAANGKDAVAAVVKTPGHLAAIRRVGALRLAAAHRARLRRGRGHVVSADPRAASHGRAGRGTKPWQLEGLSRPSRRGQPLGAQSHECWLEDQTPHGALA